MGLIDIIKWSVFTREEKDSIKKIIKTGHINALTQVIPNITKEKELEMQKIVDYMEPIAKGFKSKVRERVEKKGHPESPEEEAKIQLEMEEEYREYAEKQDLQRLKRMATLGDKEAKQKYNDLKKEISERKKTEKEEAKAEKKRHEEFKKETKRKQAEVDADHAERRRMQAENEDGVITKPIKIEEEKSNK